MPHQKVGVIQPQMKYGGECWIGRNV